jgi:hypothetical protein
LGKTAGKQQPERLSRLQTELVLSASQEPAAQKAENPGNHYTAAQEPAPAPESERCWSSNPPLNCFLRERP